MTAIAILIGCGMIAESLKSLTKAVRKLSDPQTDRGEG